MNIDNDLMKITYMKSRLKSRFIIVFLSLIAVGCAGSGNNNGSGQSPTPLTPTPPTCADNPDVCSVPYLTALYGGGVFYFNEATEINQTVKISEGEKQTFYAIIHDSDISSGESINVTINSTIKLDTDIIDSLNGYVSPPLKMDPETDPESIPSALENYTNAEGYEIFNFTLGEDLLLDDKVVGEHEILVVSIDARGLEGSSKIVVVIENVNDTPVISSLERSGGVTASSENIFEVYEGGEEGIIRVKVRDDDIQHGDIVSLNLISADLPGIISIEEDKLSQSDAVNNQVEFVLNVASGLLRDADIGEHQFRFLVHDEFGGIDGSGNFTLNVKNTDDASSATYSAIRGGVSKLDSVDGSPDIFAISEGQSGQIEVIISDEDLSRTSQLEYTITSDSIRQGVRAGLLNISRVESSSSAEEQIFLIDIGKNGSPIDDADIGIYNLNLRVADDDRAVNANYPFVLKVNNVVEQPNIISVLAGEGVSASADNNSWILSEDVVGSLSIVVEDEDFGSAQNQESINITITSPILPENFITVPQSEISRPDSSTNNRATFRIEFTAPANELVGEHNITFSFTDTDGNIVLYKREFRIENVNDAPVISALTSLDGVVSIGGDVFEVYEGGEEGIIRVKVRDVDIQHGDIVSLNITSANLPTGVISIEKDKLSQLDTINNQVEFVLNVASGLLRDADIGEHLLNFLVYDEFGGAEDTRTITLKIKNTDDASSATYSAIRGGVSKLDSVDGSPDTFAISEGQSGQIEVIISDEDLSRTSQLEYTITSDSIRRGVRAGLLNISRVESSSSAEENIFLIDIGKSGSPIDDADIGSYNLNLRVENDAGTVNANYPFVLTVNNVVEQPNIISVLAGTGVSASADNNSWILSEDVVGSLSIVVEDEDFGSAQNQESINITITSPTLPENFITVPQSEISRPDSSTNNRVTFRIEFTAPANQLVGEHNITFSFTDTDGNTALYEREFRIENVNDAPVISALTRSDGVTSNGENIFEVYEGGEEGTIRVAVRDDDIQHGDIVSLNITSANLPAGVISIEKDKLSQSDVVNNQVEFVVHIASGLLRDADIGEYILDLLVYDELGKAEDSRTITLKVNNVVEQPNIISVLAGAGVSASADGSSWILSEDVAGSLSIVVEDEDFGSVQNQESINITIMSPTLPENFITVQQSEISRPDSSTNNRVTFRIEFTAPANELVGEHNITFSFTDTDGNTALYEGKFRIENVNDAPVISALTSLDGVVSSGENIFEVYEGGEEGIIRVKVRDADIQHGDIIGLNITGANLPTGVISIEKDKLSQSDTINNQVEFIVRIASELLQDSDTGEYSLDFLVYDEFGKAEDSRTITLKVINTDDASSATYSAIRGGVSKLGSVDGSPDTFAISEGESGQINVTISDEDLIHTSQLEYTITGDSIRQGLLNISRVESSSSAEENIFLIDIGKNGNPIDDADIGSYNLNLRVTDDAGTVNANYPFVLKVNNVVEPPNIISVLAGAGVSAAADGSSWTLSEDVAGSLNIVVEDEDFGSPQNQESINITITSPTLPENFITVQQSEISRPDSSTNNRVTFRIEFTAPANQLVGEHNVTFSFTDTDGNRALYEGEFRIENVNDAPVIFSLTRSDGVFSSGENIFEAFEGGEEGTIRVAVRDVDIQHGDIVSLNITSANLPTGVISIEKDKLSQLDTINNQVEFVLNVASGLLRDADIGEYLLDLLVYDEFDGAKDKRTITLKIKNTDDASSATYSAIRGGVSKLDSVDGASDTFAISEGQSGQIEVIISDEDLSRTSQLEYTITSDSIRQGVRAGLLNISRVESSSSAEENIFLIDIGKSGSPIDDADIGSYNLNLRVEDDAGTVNANYPFVLKVNNVVEQPNIISVLAGTGISASANNNSWILSEDVAGSLSIVVEDEDFGSAQNQESINITIMSPTLPQNFITVQQSEISRPDSSTNNRATFRIEFTAPANELVGEHNITFSFTDTDGNIVLYKRKFKIENVNDAPVIFSLTRSDGVFSSGENIFEVYEGGEEGIIRVTVRDADIQHGDIVGLNITDANLPTGVISIEADKLSQSDAINNQVEFVLNVASGLLRDTDIGEYLLDLLVYDEFGGAEDTRTITLKVNNVVEQPNIISVLAGAGVSASADGSSWILSEDVAGSLSIVVEDEDLESPQNQESINITITSPTLSENFITVQQSEISRPDSSTNNRVTFRIEFTAPANQLVGEHNVTFSFTDTTGNIVLYKREFKIENVNDAPVISAITSLDGVVSIGGDVFEVFEGGDNGAIKVIVNDADIQHGDVVGLNITGANLPTGVISIEANKLSQSDAINNQVEFIVRIASELLQDSDTGEYSLDFLVYDELGKAEDSRTITLKVINIDDASSATYSAISGGVSKLDSVDDSPDIFAISEGQSGQIKIAISDEDLIHSSQLEYTITGDSIRQGIRVGLLNITRVEPSSSAEEHIFLIDIGKSGSPIDDADIGSYNLNLRVENDAGTVNANYPFILKVNNVVEQPNIISVLAGAGVSASADGSSWTLSEDVAGSLSIVVEDEDFGSPQNQESINITIMSPTLPENFITVPQSEISRPDSSTNNRVTFRIEFTAPANQLVGEHNITFSFTDTTGNIVLYKREFRIENVNDVPEISMMDSARGVTSNGENIFEVYEGGEEGIIRVKVRDVDIQHGDIVSLNLISADLPGIISIEEDKLSQSDAMNNQVEFVLNVASGLLRDADIGEHQFRFLVHDEFGGIDGSGNFTLNVKNTDDTSSINYLAISGRINKLSNADGVPDTFAISEGQSGQIQVIISDEDLIHTSQLEYTITSDSIRQGIREGLLNITRVESLSSAEEHIFLIDVGKSGGPIDDADIGNYNLNLRIFDVSADRRVDALYPFVLEINNVPEPTAIINVQAGQGAVAGTGTNYFVLIEEILASLDIIVMDEDLVNPLAQENITMETIPSDLPNDLLLTKSLYVTRPDTVGGNQATFTLEIAAPRNEDARDDNYTIPFIISGAGGKSLVGEISIRIENVNDTPVISALTHSGGVGRAAPADENTFIVSEGGVNGAITVTVEDPDIQHGDTVSLDIINDALLGDSAFIDKYFSVESSIAGTNQVEFTIHIASGLMQEIDIGEYHFQLSVYDNFGGSATRDLIVIVEDTDDLTTISNFGWTGNLTSISPAPSNERDLFIIYEGQSGQIEFTFSDEDLALTPLVVSNITGDPIDSQIINATIRTKPSSPDERILTINIGNNSSGTQKIDDMHIGTYELSLNISSSAGEVAINYPFTLQIINVEEQPRIIKILPSFGLSSGPIANSFILTQNIATTFIIVVEDEDFANPQNQENIIMTSSHPTDPNHPFLTLVSYVSPQINLPDTRGGKRATFVAKIAAPSNDFVGEHALSITTIDSSARTANLDLNLTILNANDAPRIINITSSGSVRRSSVDNFVVAEGASPNGGIDVIVEDVDFLFGDKVSLAVASATLNTKFISVAKAHIDESDADPNHQVIFNIDILSESLNDAEVGTHILEINATDAEGVVATRQVNLVVENVNDAPEIVSITYSESISKNLKDAGNTGDEYTYNLNEGDSGVLYIKIMDEDLIHSHENITVSWTNPLTRELLSFDKTSFSSTDVLEDGTVNFILRLGQDADFDNIHVGPHFIFFSISDSTGAVVNAGGELARSRIIINIVNVQERPFFPQIDHNIVVFEQSGGAELSAGTVIATIGQAYCSAVGSTSGCASPAPVLEANDPDPGDTIRLSYELQSIGTENFYLDGLKLKNRHPIRVGEKESVIIHVVDPYNNRELLEGYIVVHVKRLNNLNQDSDGDGVRDPYDGAPGNPAAQTMGSGTHADPYLIHNIYQLQAIAGVDHQGNSLQASEFTGNSYLYGNGLLRQLSSHYRLVNDVSASITSTWNRGGGFIPIGTGVCNSSDVRCDTATAARLVDGTPVRFSGTFDGSNFEISGLTINRQSSYLGLFGEAGVGSVIANLELTSANIINSATRSNPSDAVKFSHGGVLVGQMLGGTIDNVRVTGRFMGIDYKYAGGVAGSLSSSANGAIPGIITNSMADVDITANGIEFGGLVGVLGRNSLIQASNAKGNVMSAVNDNNALLANYVGGLVGISRGYIFASYATGNVRGYYNVGGLVGNVLGGATTANFATGDVEGIIQVGGLVGEMLGGTHRYLYYSGQLIRSSYTSATPEFIGGIIGKLWARTTIYSVINMRSSNPYDTPKGGLVFGLLDLTVVQDIPNIHNAYSIYVLDNSLGYIAHKSYGTAQGGPLSLLGDNAASIKAIPMIQLKYCSNDALLQGLLCTGLFNNNFWRDLRVSSLGSSYNVDWSIPSDNYPALKVQRVTGTGELDDASILPSPEEQRCHIEPEYTHPTYCPTTIR